MYKGNPELARTPCLWTTPPNQPRVVLAVHLALPGLAPLTTKTDNDPAAATETKEEAAFPAGYGAILEEPKGEPAHTHTHLAPIGHDRLDSRRLPVITIDDIANINV